MRKQVIREISQVIAVLSLFLLMLCPPSVVALTTPSIQTSNATSVATTVAQLNSLVILDGGGNCAVRFGYDTVSQATFTNYTTITSWSSYSYTAGSTPYYLATGLVANTTYFFRVQIRNVDANYTATNEVVFTTASSISPPDDFIAVPASDSVSLSWTKGSGSYTTYILQKVGSYSTSTTDGTIVYNGTLSNFEVTGLTAGTNYYYTALGAVLGSFSASNTTLMITTLAGGTSYIAQNFTQSVPSTWYQNTTSTAFASNPFLPFIVDIATAYSIPQNTIWYILAMVIALSMGVWVYSKSFNLMLAVFVIGIGMAFSVYMHLIPGWTVLVYLVFAIAIAVISTRYGS